MEFIYNDGGRLSAGFRGRTGDCVARAIAIAAQVQYRTAYDKLNSYAKKEHPRKKKGRSSARNGVKKQTYTKYLLTELNWDWTPLTKIGTGCLIHLATDELPSKGRLILSLSGHLTAWVDGRLHDIYDCSRSGTRQVYGIFHEKEFFSTEEGFRFAEFYTRRYMEFSTKKSFLVQKKGLDSKSFIQEED